MLLIMKFYSFPLPNPDPPGPQTPLESLMTARDFNPKLNSPVAEGPTELSLLDSDDDDAGVGDFDARSSRRNFAASCQLKESNLNKMSFIVE